MALTKAEMAERLFEEVGLNKREAKEFVDSFFDALREALERGQQVKLSGFGNFDLRQKNQRPGPTPQPGYWETDFTSLKPVKRRGNRRYYQRHDVLMIRQIRGLLYEEGYTISGARQRLEGETGRMENSMTAQVVKQVRMELEEVLNLLRR